MTIKRMLLATAATTALTTASAAFAAGDCGTVRFGQVSWTGVSAKTETAAWMLEQMGYETDVVTASLPIMFQSLSTDERDVFTGFWVPTSRAMASEYMKEGSVDLIGANLEGAKYTVAVPSYVHEAGVKSFADLDEHKDKFGGRIYGIEAGNDGNEIIKQMIADDAYGLGDWELVPSSEAGMLAEVKRRVPQEKWIGYLAWAPHPMNINIDMEYLAGGAEYWGPNKGGATVYTLAREGYAWQCPNVGQFLENFTLTVNEQSWMSARIVNDDMDYAEAGRALIQENPELLDRWFSGGGTYQTGPVRTADGERNAREAVAAALGE